VHVWRPPPIDLERSAVAAKASAPTNLKAVLFFAAFLPQFIDPACSLLLQFCIMAGTFAVVEVATEFLLASMAHRLRPWLRRVGRASTRSAAVRSWPLT
jgi:homoserine/homoserine lactone efflux protein